MRLFVYCIIPVTAFYYFLTYLCLALIKMYVETKIKCHRKLGNLLPFRAQFCLAHISLASFLLDMGKQYRPRTGMK